VILAIDTSADIAGVAVASGDSILGEITWSGRARHSALLGVSIERLLEATRVTPGELTAVAVASGPGSFSGLRVGISAAKGLAMALDIPVAPVGTLDAIGWQASALAPSVLALLPAGRGQVYAALYVGKDESWRRVETPHILTVAEAVELGRAALLAGEAARIVAEAARGNGETPSLAPPAWNLRRPGFLAELGRLYLDSGGSDQRDQLEPQDLRRSAAEEKRGAAQE
jgi:tRNA threonylcarbamoyladenosine biosynthesis protein TsaB